jgi:glyoxylase-like metal-dependent hydrolase (beta-lactamase superfamily II)
VDDVDRHAWEQAGAHAVGPGIYRVPLPLPNDGLRAVNVYVIEDGDGLVLVDGGWAMADATEVLERALGELDRGLRDIREFLVTHLHRDHYTQAIAVRQITGSAVAVGEGEKACLDAIHSLEVHPDIARMHLAGADDIAQLLAGWHGERDVSYWEYPDRWLADGIDLPLQSRILRAIHTPGHTAGHMVFHDPQANILFAGDHVLPHITPSIGVELVRPESPLRDYLASLRIVRSLPDAQLLPAHGPVAASTHARVDELLDHHDERLNATASAVAAGASTAVEVARRLPWTRRHHKLEDLDLFNKILAIQETMAHLDVLVERGWLTRALAEDGVAHYAAA